MTTKEALDIGYELECTDLKPIPCTVSTSRISGKGLIVDVINKFSLFPDITVLINGSEENIPCIGVERAITIKS